jgi:hypothetical protein
MDIHLRTNHQDPALSLLSVERFAGESGYRVMLEVRSRGFELRAPFYFEPAALSRFIDELDAMDLRLSGSAKLKPMWEEHFIDLTLTALGRIVVCGEVFEYSDHPQHLRFEFETDQTVLRPFINDLKECACLPAQINDDLG